MDDDEAEDDDNDHDDAADHDHDDIWLKFTWL